MHQCIELTKFFLDGAGDVVIVLLRRAFQIQRNDARLRATGFLDLIIELLKVGHRATQQNNRRALTGTAEADFAAKSAISAGN